MTSLLHRLLPHSLFVPLLLALALLPAIGRPLQAERPTAHGLLPEKTLAILHMSDSREFVSKFQSSAMGRMLDDDQIKPLAKYLYGSVADAFGQVQDQVGLPLEKILSIPKGEFCVALVQPNEGPPALVAILEVGTSVTEAQTLIDRATEQIERQGAVRTTERVGDIVFTIFQFQGERRRQLMYGIKEGVILVSSNMDVAKEVVARWNGEAPKDSVTLAQNRKYTGVMNRCQGTKDERPQVSFYLDPLDLVRAGARGNFAAQTALAILPAIGLDGLQAVGGSLILSAEEFDMIQHLHVLMDSPRAGVLKAIALEPSASEPEPWVPSDVAAYTTFNWQVGTTYAEVSRLIDSFQSEGSTDKLFKERVSDPLGIDAKTELIDAMDGRMTLLTWFERPIRVNSQTRLLGIKLKDADAFRKTLDKMIAKYEAQFTKDTFGGVVYHRINVPQGPPGGPRRRGPQANDPNAPDGNAPVDQPRVRMEVRAPEPCMAILGDYVVLCDSVALLRQCIVTQSDSSKSLANELDFKLITGKINRQVGGQTPALLTFNRPEEGMRMLYDLALADNTRQNLAGAAQNNPVFRVLNEALEKNPLPPFSVLAQYLSPGGGMVTSDETGFHYTAFGLRRK
ncbi:MAG: hypothetical protein ACKPEY_03015 [Planctomycetota bacterium]